MDEENKGLGATAGEWPEAIMLADNERIIDKLAPNTEAHKRVLTYLLKRLNSSEREMGKFYARWRWNEQRAQAYVALPKYEELLKEANATGAPPKITSIIMPYTFATMATIVTYLIQVFAGRKPMFQISTYNSAAVENAQNMETVLQYNCEHVRLIKHLFQFFSDGELYGVQILRTAWKSKKAMRSKFIERPQLGFLSTPDGSKFVRQREEKIVFEGTEVFAQDPFMFFPDPRVPMSEVSRRGEFVFWRTFEGKHTLKKAEADGDLKYIDQVPTMQTKGSDTNGGNSNRSLLSGGDSHPGMYTHLEASSNYYQIDQGTIDIIPAELGLGSSTNIERWLFSIANKTQIIQAEKIELDHGMHPVIVGEPYTLGYGFGQCGISDYLGPVQDTISWFLNSHIQNVRTALNNMFVVDPSLIEMQDLKNPEPGKIIRLKRAAYGRDVRQAVQQLAVSDITRAHINDLDVFMRIGDSLAAVNDNLRGLQDAGGRKSATEARSSMDAAASRLAAHAKLISAQSLSDLAEQMVLNYQQNMSEEFELSLMGPEKTIRISPEMLVGDFVYPVNDGTLPVDRVALLDVWKEVMMAVMQDPQLRSEYSVPKLFSYVAELGGAKNLESMKLAGTEQIQAQAQAGNLVSLKEIGGQTSGLPPTSPGSRIAGALG